MWCGCLGEDGTRGVCHVASQDKGLLTRLRDVEAESGTDVDFKQVSPASLIPPASLASRKGFVPEAPSWKMTIRKALTGRESFTKVVTRRESFRWKPI